jgi:hypothetical protein
VPKRPASRVNSTLFYDIILRKSEAFLRHIGAGLITDDSVFYTILTGVVGEIIWSRTCKQRFYRFSLVSELRCFYVGVAFIIVIVNFYKVNSF